MNITAREKIMLLALLLVAIIAVGYYFVFVPVMEKSSDLIMKRIDVQAQADEVQIELAALPRIRNDVDEYKNSLTDLAAPFYAVILQDELILQIDDLIKLSGIMVDAYSFSQQQGITVMSSAAVMPEAESQESQQGENSDSDAAVNEAAPVTQNVESTIANTQLLSADIQFSGTYDQLRSFISQAEGLNRAIRISNLSYQVDFISPDEQEESVQPETPDVQDEEENEEENITDADEEEAETETADQTDTNNVQTAAVLRSGIRGSFTIEFYAINTLIAQDA